MISFTRIKHGASAEIIAYKKNRVISIIFLAFAGVIYGFGTRVSLGSQDIDLYPSGLAIFLYFVSLTNLYSACMNSFKDMHDRPSADVQMSMPLSSSERYLSRLLTICYIWLFPFLISAAGGITIAALIEMFRGKQHVVNNRVVTTPFPGFVISESLKYMLWFMAAVMFMIAVTVVCQCCTGAKAESRYTPILLMFVLSIMPYGVYSLSDKFCKIETGSKIPFYYVWSFSQLFAFEPDDERFVLMSLINCLISAAVIAGGLFIYKKRDARSVGMPVAFPLFLEITVFSALMLLFCIVHADSGIEGIVLFLSWLGSIILRIICARKSFSAKKIGIWSGLFAAYYVLFLTLMYVIFTTGCFGAMYRKADLSPYIGEHLHVEFDIIETWSSYPSSSREDILRENLSYICAYEKETATRSMMDIGAKYAAKSIYAKGAFADEMFGSLRPEHTYDCCIAIYRNDDTNSYYNYSWHTPIYRIKFKLPRKDAVSMSEELLEAAKITGGYITRDGM